MCFRSVGSKSVRLRKLGLSQHCTLGEACRLFRILDLVERVLGELVPSLLRLGRQ